MTINLSENSKAFFIALMKDAGNWSGSPLFGGNVGGSQESKGWLTDLKRKGLLITEQDGDNRKCQWVYFTNKGCEYAIELGLKDYVECITYSKNGLPGV